MKIATFPNTGPSTSHKENAPGRRPPVVPLWVKWRNSIFDRMFYNVRSLSLSEQYEVMRRTSTEGEMMVVRPAKAQAPIEYYALSADLLERYHGEDSIDAIAIPGVGSSDLGTAALARTVADATGRTVIGVIPGYGALDIMSEALGGWFIFGVKNRMRAFNEFLKGPKDLTETRLHSHERLMREYRVKSTTLIEEEPESNSILNLLLRNQHKTRLLVGHSKGCLNIANALHAFVKEVPNKKSINTGIEIVTFACGVNIPPVFENVRQYVGRLDLLGRVNTPLSLYTDPELDWVSIKVHTLNRLSPLHMPAETLI